MQPELLCRSDALTYERPCGVASVGDLARVGEEGCHEVDCEASLGQSERDRKRRGQRTRLNEVQRSGRVCCESR